jgi:hypothetical protein
METILIFAAVLAPIFVVMVPWGTVLAMGLSKQVDTLTTRGRRRWKMCLEALMLSLGGLVVVPAVAGIYYFLVSREVLGLAGIIFGVVTLGLWFYAAKRLGLWRLWRAVFHKHTQ